MVMGYTHKHICHLFVCHAFLAPLLSFQKWTGAAAVSFLFSFKMNGQMKLSSFFGHSLMRYSIL